MGALSAYFRTVLDPQNEVLVPEPHFPAYLVHIRYARGEVVHVSTSFSKEFIPDRHSVEALLTDRSHVLLLNSPNNPTGAMIPGEVLDDLARLAFGLGFRPVGSGVHPGRLHRGLGETGRSHDPFQTVHRRIPSMKPWLT
jgi:aspartate/methionine/tyrosine aminotransferase